MPKFSIIIPTASNFDGLKLCLESIVKFTDLSETEIVVVANGASQELRSLDYPINIRWFDEMIGFARAVNEGIKVAKAPYVILLNDDCILLDQPKNNWIERLYAPFSDPRMGIVGELTDRSPATDRDFLLFFCVMIRKAMLDEIGTLDEAFLIGAGEDTDLCHRAEDNGWKIVSVGGETTYADRGDPTLPSYQQGQWVNTFPLYHQAGCTVGKVEGFQEIFARNAEILRQRYGVNIERAKTVEGWMADSELEWLARQARQTHGIVIEIGSWSGRSSRAIADNLPQGSVLYCVDTFCGSSGEPDAHATAKQREGDAVFMKFFENLYDHILLGRVVPVRMESGNAAETLAKMGVKADICFIDADHSYEGVKRDIELWHPLVKENGSLCGHDYYLPEQNPLAWIGVRRCVDELFPEATQAPNTTIWTVKVSAESAWNMLRRRMFVTEPFGEYGGFFCTGNRNTSLQA